MSDLMAILNDRGSEVDDDLIVHVYEFILAHECATSVEVATALRVPETEVKDAVALLRDLRLLRYSERLDGFLAVCPETAQNELVLPLQREVNDKRRELAGIHQRLHALSGIFSNLRRSRPNGDKIVALLDPQQASLHLADALQYCSSEVLAMQLYDGGTRPGFPVCELAKGSSGAPVRLVYPHTARARATTRNRLRQMIGSGARVRTSNHVFDNLVLVGNDAAFVAHQVSDEDIPSIIVVYEPTIIDLLHRLYDFAWQAGTDFEVDVASYGETLNELNSTVISLMAQGLKDEVVARRVGVGSRTLRRHISNIMDRLGASSRFQAGVVAARAGFLDGKPI